MIRIALSILFLFCAFYGRSQFGIRSMYNLNSYPDWERIVESANLVYYEDLLDVGYTIEVDYWMRLRNQRIEFFPSLQYTYANSSIDAIEEATRHNFKSIGFALNTHFYPLDFFGDCDCPTFKKQGSFFKKGFFINVSPAITYVNKRIDHFSSTPEVDHSQINVSIALGAGVDIGINNLLTISPIVQYRYTPSSDFPGISAAHGIVHATPPDETSSIGQLQLGLRLGFRFDYKD